MADKKDIDQFFAKPKNDDDGELFLDSLIGADFEQGSEEKNLIEEDLKTHQKPEKRKRGRPPRKDVEKADQRVVGYITKTEKGQFDEKRGMIGESKIVAALVKKWISGEVKL